MKFFTTITLAALSFGASARVIDLDPETRTDKFVQTTRPASNSTGIITRTFTVRKYPESCTTNARPTVTSIVTRPTGEAGRFSILPYNPSDKREDILAKRFTPPPGGKLPKVTGTMPRIPPINNGRFKYEYTTITASTCRPPKPTRLARPALEKRQRVVTIYRTVVYKGGRPQPTPQPQQPQQQQPGKGANNNPKPAAPAPAPAPAQAPSGGFQQQILQLHNEARARHQVGPLVWDNKLAEFALGHAKKCVWGHSSNRSKISSQGKDAGENIATGSDVVGSMKMFMDEEKNYNYATGASKGGVIGHFTQIVWKGTTSVGCAEVDCGKYPQPAGRAWNKYIVCNYSDPGNFGGRYKENVFPPK